MKDDKVLDLGRERDNRALRARVTKLEAELDAYRSGSLDVATLTKHSSDCEREVQEVKGGIVSQIRVRTHLRVWVDYEARKVRCQVCGEDLDPIHVLHEYATLERQFARCSAALHEKQRELRHEIELLEKQRTNLRAAIRRAGGTPVDQYSARLAEHVGTDLDLSAERSRAVRAAEDRTKKAMEDDRIRHTTEELTRRVERRAKSKRRNSAVESVSTDPGDDGDTETRT